jgi:serine protease Do
VKLLRPGLLALAGASLVAFGGSRASADGRAVGTLPDPSASANASTSALSADRIEQGLVTVLVGGHVTGIGTVLDGDGRMLTSLSAVGPHDAADVRYANGHVVHARAMHKDPVLDLALLVPMSGRYTTGLLASEQDPMQVALRTASLGGHHPTLVQTKLKDHIDAHAKDGTSLSGAWEIDHPPPAGSPVVDPNGRALGVAGKACRGPGGAGNAPCAAVTVFIPILQIRIFLSHTPATAVAPAPWLGINGVPDSINGIRGVRVQAVAPRSPAERSGLHTQRDLIVVADGQPLDTPERLAKIVAKHAVGDVLKLSVFAGGRYREVSVTLAAAP